MSHATDRALKRYGITLSGGDLKRIVEQVRKGSLNTYLLELGRGDSQVVAVLVKGKWVPFVIDRCGKVITALSRRTLSPHEKVLRRREALLYPSLPERQAQ